MENKDIDLKDENQSLSEIEINEKEQYKVTREDIQIAVQNAFKNNPSFRMNNNLVMFVFNILKSIFIDGYRFVMLDAPTGTGKSIYAYILSECYIELKNKQKVAGDYATIQNYMLTSSLILQNQIMGDIERFKLNSTAILKGGTNYTCDELTDRTQIHHSYAHRSCKSFKMARIENLPCFDTCGYLQARNEAQFSNLSVLNYQYFSVAVRKPDQDEFDEEGNLVEPEFKIPSRFITRSLTICDEAHLIPEIIINRNKIDLSISKYIKLYNKTKKMLTYKPNSSDLDSCQILLKSMKEVFYRKGLNLEDVILILTLESKIDELLNLVKKGVKDFDEEFGADVDIEKAERESRKDASKLLYSLRNRPDDMLIDSSWDDTNKCYLHTIYDMNEFYVVRNNFIDKLETGIFMSATLGSFTEFANLMGIYKDEYIGYKVPSTFNFENSPIYLVNSAWLNFKNFDKNVGKVLSDTLLICEADVNKDFSGVIHTSTFRISFLLRDLVNSGKVKDKNRYLFYENSKEKGEMIEKMRNETPNNYILSGPSLLEGISLDGDLGRLNIFIKIPYAALTEYIRAKMVRIPYYYKRSTIEKIIQGIGRTNRFKEDWSKVYLMDSGFSDLIFDCDEEIVGRLKKFR